MNWKLIESGIIRNIITLLNGRNYNTIRELALDLRSDYATIHKHLHQLDKFDFIEITKKNRSRNLRLTDKGKNAFRLIENIRNLK